MLLYLIIILISVVIISAANLIGQAVTFSLALDLLVRTGLGAVAIIGLDGLFAFLIRRLTPEKWYQPEHKIFEVSKKEQKFYRSIGVKIWGNKIPELGGFTGFHKDKLRETGDIEYLRRFLIEANYGVIIHIENALFGFLILFIPFLSSPSVWIPIFAVNFLLSLMPLAALRNSSHTILKLYKRSLNKQTTILA